MIAGLEILDTKATLTLGSAFLKPISLKSDKLHLIKPQVLMCLIPIYFHASSTAKI